MFDFNGSDDAKIVVENMLKHSRIPHALIIQGQMNGRRELLANYIAKGAVCTGEGKPCGDCVACKKAESGNHPDIAESSGGTTNKSFKVEKIREIRSDAYIIPNEAEHKVYILNNAESMSAEAQNALLKVLEEPPSYIVFILLCEQSAKLLSTVRSRAVTLTLTESNVADAQIMQNAEDILLAVLSENELALLKLTMKHMTGKEANILLFPVMSSILRTAYLIKLQGKKTDDCAKTLASKLTVSQILALIEVIDKAEAAVLSNVNNTLLVTNFSAGLRTAVGL